MCGVTRSDFTKTLASSLRCWHSSYTHKLKGCQNCRNSIMLPWYCPRYLINNKTEMLNVHNYWIELILNSKTSEMDKSHFHNKLGANLHTYISRPASSRGSRRWPTQHNTFVIADGNAGSHQSLIKVWELVTGLTHQHAGCSQKIHKKIFMHH